MSRKHPLLRLNRQLDALMLFAYCKMLLSSDLFMFVFKCQPSCPDFTTNSVVLLLQRGFFSCFINGVGGGFSTESLHHPCWCQIFVVDISHDVLGHKHAFFKTTLWWCLGVWSSAVNHRFGFAYIEDAVTSSNTTALRLSLSSPLLSVSLILINY